MKQINKIRRTYYEKADRDDKFSRYLFVLNHGTKIPEQIRQKDTKTRKNTVPDR